MPLAPDAPTAPLHPSLWAAVTPPGPVLSALEEAAEADLVIIGAGFTGLSAALTAIEAGHSVIVIEASEPGYGASGRTNGQVIPTLSRPDPDDLVKRWGEAGERLVLLLRDGAGYLFNTLRRLDIFDSSEAEQAGWLQPAHSPGRIRIAERRVAQWSRVGADVALLSRAEMREATGSDLWFGGWTARTGGHINPLALCRNLTRVLLAKGARVFARSPATGLSHDGTSWTVTTGKGRVRANGLVLATNAYTGEFAKALHPGIATEIVPVHSFQMATPPIGDNMRAAIIPGRQAVSDTHGDLHFARYDKRNRLITGGALMVPVNAESRLPFLIGPRLATMFPQLGEVSFDYVWSGYIGMTVKNFGGDYFPRVHQLGPGGWAWAGCNGRGIALSFSLGRDLAKAALGTDPKTLALPVEPVQPVPFHGIARRLGPFMLMKYRQMDAREIA
jgi:glycine/D-amino acid oxidase-like deaminating enzyme